MDSGSSSERPRLLEAEPFWGDIEALGEAWVEAILAKEQELGRDLHPEELAQLALELSDELPEEAEVDGF